MRPSLINKTIFFTVITGFTEYLKKKKISIILQRVFRSSSFKTIENYPPVINRIYLYHQNMWKQKWHFRRKQEKKMNVVLIRIYYYQFKTLKLRRALTVYIFIQLQTRKFRLFCASKLQNFIGNTLRRLIGVFFQWNLLGCLTKKLLYFTFLVYRELITLDNKRENGRRV